MPPSPSQPRAPVPSPSRTSVRPCQASGGGGWSTEGLGQDKDAKVSTASKQNGNTYVHTCPSVPRCRFPSFGQSLDIISSVCPGKILSGAPPRRTMGRARPDPCASPAAYASVSILITSFYHFPIMVSFRPTYILTKIKPTRSSSPPDPLSFLHSLRNNSPSHLHPLPNPYTQCTPSPSPSPPSAASPALDKAGLVNPSCGASVASVAQGN